MGGTGICLRDRTGRFSAGLDAGVITGGYQGQLLEFHLNNLVGISVISWAEETWGRSRFRDENGAFYLCGGKMAEQ